MPNNPVSYTHLDVYKRQGQDCPYYFGRSYRLRSCAADGQDRLHRYEQTVIGCTSTNPVSYTHLHHYHIKNTGIEYTKSQYDHKTCADCQKHSPWQLNSLAISLIIQLLWLIDKYLLYQLEEVDSVCLLYTSSHIHRSHTSLERPSHSRHRTSEETHIHRS